MINVTVVLLIDMPCIFPLEIEERILDLLAEVYEGHSALKNCSLVCKAFLPICRKHIFKSIVLEEFHENTPPFPSDHASSFDRLLRETPEIANYIRKLDYNIRYEHPSLESFTQISRLESLTVWQRQLSRPRLDWSKNPIRPAFLHLLHLPTLTHFKVTRVAEFVLSDLIPCINLKYLDIGSDTSVATENAFPSTLPEHSIQLNEFVSGSNTSIMKLCSARRPDGQPIIDFGSLSKIKVPVDLDDPNEVEASRELFRRCHALTNVNLSFKNSCDNDRPNLADMLRPSMQTLKHIVVNVYAISDDSDDYVISDDSDADPLDGIPSDLEDMRAKNNIETVTIELIIGRSEMNACVRRKDDWGRLAEVLTSPGWFSLKRVLLTIKFVHNGWKHRKVLVAFRKLLETQFRRLSSSDSVLFDFEIIPYHIYL